MVNSQFPKDKNLLWDSSVQGNPHTTMWESGTIICQNKLFQVANRDNPIPKNDSSGVLSINLDRNLVFHNNYSKLPILSTNVSVTHPNSIVIAQLLETVNLILTRSLDNKKTIIWQGFDHPIDTMLPYLKLGFNKRTN